MPTQRWFCSTIVFMRSCLVVLVFLYTGLFLSFTVEENSATVTNSFLGSSEFAESRRRPLSPTENVFPLSTPNGLVEGRVDYYSRSNEAKPLWEYSTILPDWMKSYLVWHKERRAFLEDHPEHWRSLQYHVIECTRRYPNCGGTADRLGSLPFHVQFAASCNPPRLLFYHWTVPAPLESFLLPPQLGVDWRLPSWLLQRFDGLPFPRVKKHRQKNTMVQVAGDLSKLMHVLQMSADKAPLLVRAKTQSHDHGANDYNSLVFLKTAKHLDIDLSIQPTFQQVFHDLWRVFFTPAPPIASKIEEHMTNLHLSPDSYIAMHLRLLYGNTKLTSGQIKGWTQRMIHCTLQYLVPAFHEAGEDLTVNATKIPMPPLLFVADSQESVQAASEYAKLYKILLVHRPYNGNRDPLHLEKDVSREKKTSNLTEPPIVEDFHDTFVDIYTIGMSRCVAYQNGGFGRWGSVMSYNSTCSFFLKPSAPQICPRPNLENYVDFNSTDIPVTLPLFVPPMIPAGTASNKPKTTESQIENAFMDSENANHIEVIKDALLYKSNDEITDLWWDSAVIPTWMKEYLEWHKQQRQQMLTPSKWNQTRYLVMSCKEGRICGGTSDRLKPIPTMLRHAATTKRVLLIQWERPCMLEEFLLPPKGGLDWRVPEWLLPKLWRDGTELVSTSNIWKNMDSPLRTIRSVFQAMDGGASWYNENLQEGEASFQEIYHLAWGMMFTPVPKIARTITHILDDNGLSPYKYTAAHLRVLYNKEDRKEEVLKKWTRGALNCASNLNPGQPIFLASDSAVVTEYGPIYGREKNGTVIIHENDPSPPLHLDRGDWNTSGSIRRPSDYYDTFTDLYLLALSGCLFHSKGGYGLWAAYINGNLTCGYKSKGWSKLLSDCDEFKAPPDVAKPTAKVSNKQLFMEPVAFS